MLDDCSLCNANLLCIQARPLREFEYRFLLIKNNLFVSNCFECLRLFSGGNGELDFMLMAADDVVIGKVIYAKMSIGKIVHNGCDDFILFSQFVMHIPRSFLVTSFQLVVNLKFSASNTKFIPSIIDGEVGTGKVNVLM